MFPSLVNCCTIDWFREWPMEALHSVALSFYSDLTGLEPEGAAEDEAAGPSPLLQVGVWTDCVLVECF